MEGSAVDLNCFPLLEGRGLAMANLMVVESFFYKK